MFAAAAAPAIVRAESIMRIAPPKILLLDDQVLRPYWVEVKIDQTAIRNIRWGAAAALHAWAFDQFQRAEDEAIMRHIGMGKIWDGRS